MYVRVRGGRRSGGGHQTLFVVAALFAAAAFASGQGVLGVALIVVALCLAR